MSPEWGDGNPGLAIAPPGLRDKRASYRGFASLTPGYAPPAPFGAGFIGVERSVPITAHDGIELSDSLGYRLPATGYHGVARGGQEAAEADLDGLGRGGECHSQAHVGVAGGGLGVIDGLGDVGGDLRG